MSSSSPTTTSSLDCSGSDVSTSSPARQLQSLSFATTLPSASSVVQRRALPLGLHHIESISVSTAPNRRQGKTYYTLSVFTKADAASTIAPRISYARTSVAPNRTGDENFDTLRKPSYQLEKTLEQVEELRGALYQVTHSAHTFAFCDFCKEMIFYTCMSDKMPHSMVRWLVKPEKVVRKLERFVNTVVGIMSAQLTADSEPWCSGHVKSRQVLRQFLVPRMQELQADMA